MAKEKQTELVPAAGQEQEQSVWSIAATESLNAAEDVLLTPEGRPAGVEIAPEQLVVPRLALVQKQSRLVDERVAEPGQLVSTLTLEPLWPLPQHRFRAADEVPETLKPFLVPGAEPPLVGLPFLPIKCYTDRIMFSSDFSLACRSLPGGLHTVPGFQSPAWREGQNWDPHSCLACPLKNWSETGEKPLCNEVYNVIGYALNITAETWEELLGQLVAVRFARSSLNVGRNMVSAIAISGRNPWAYLWTLWSTQVTNEFGAFYVWRARRAIKDRRALPTPARLVEQAQATYAALAAETVKIDLETAAAIEELDSAC